MTHPTDWTEALLAFGETRGWSPLPKRALRKFRDFAHDTFGIEVAAGLPADAAFRHGYAALRRATTTERSACSCWHDVSAFGAAQAAAVSSRRKPLRPTFYGSALNPDLVVPAESVPFPTVVAVPLLASDEADARRRLAAWHAIETASNRLDQIAGHGTCGNCTCAAWLRKAKADLAGLVADVEGLARASGEMGE